MLRIEVDSVECYDDFYGFYEVKGGSLLLEHSLISLSKWESKHHKPFLSEDEVDISDSIDYIKCMTINKVNPSIYSILSNKNLKQINDYINDPMTATTFSNTKSSGSVKTIMTSEIIYYYMISLNIPMECEKWHLNRLLALIRVCSEKNSPPKKMSKSEIMDQNRRLNEQRRAQMKSKG